MPPEELRRQAVLAATDLINTKDLEFAIVIFGSGKDISEKKRTVTVSTFVAGQPEILSKVFMEATNNMVRQDPKFAIFMLHALLHTTNEAGKPEVFSEESGKQAKALLERISKGEKDV